ncbi:MAG: folate-dependent phosphoribosylglycinamide formyltransferase PurN [Bacteriovoracaceae bacterium]|jgi:methionyl-tRNA formyltransferase
MKIIVVIDETPYYHPKFMQDIIDVLGDKIVGVALVTKIPKKHSLAKSLINQIYLFRLTEVLKIFRKNLCIFRDYLLQKEERTHYRVKSILRKNSIPFICVENNINKKKYIDWLQARSPDVLFSSCTLYFREEILGLPKLCCLNRHAAHLPSYKGVWAIFHAYRNKEKTIGSSIHKMTLKIDGGEVVAQKIYSLNRSMSIDDLYRQSYSFAVKLLLEALKNLQEPSYQAPAASVKDSYYSFPTKEQVLEFRELKGKFI